MTAMVLDLPNDLAERLRPFEHRLPELLERGMRDALQASERVSTEQDETAILELLASSPSPEAILALRPSPELQSRASALLAESKAGTISPSGETELEKIMLLERLVRIAKANAHKQLGQAE